MWHFRPSSVKSGSWQLGITAIVHRYDFKACVLLPSWAPTKSYVSAVALVKHALTGLLDVRLNDVDTFGPERCWKRERERERERQREKPSIQPVLQALWLGAPGLTKPKQSEGFATTCTDVPGIEKATCTQQQGEEDLDRDGPPCSRGWVGSLLRSEKKNLSQPFQTLDYPK